MVWWVLSYYELGCGLELDESCCGSVLGVWQAGLAESCCAVELTHTGSTQLCRKTGEKGRGEEERKEGSYEAEEVQK